MKEKDKHNIKTIKSNVAGLFNGSIVASELLRKQVPFIFFVFVLALIYIANRYHAEGIYRETVKTEKQIEDYKSTKIEIQSDLMIYSRRENILKMLKEKESTLVESKTASRIIRYKQNELEK